MNVLWGVARSFLFEERPRSRSRLTVMIGLANALTSPPTYREGRTPLDEKDGLLVVYPVRCMAPDLQIFLEFSPRLVCHLECKATLL